MAEHRTDSMNQIGALQRSGSLNEDSLERMMENAQNNARINPNMYRRK